MRRRAEAGSTETTYLVYLTRELKERVKEAAAARKVTAAVWWREAAERQLKHEARSK